MLMFKKKYYLLIENTRDINLNLIKIRGKFNVIYRNLISKERIETLKIFKNNCKKYGIDDKLILVNEYDRENIPPSVLQSFDTNKLKMAEISLFLKHMYCMGGIIQSGKPYGIIMEDDVVFKDDFVTVAKSLNS